MGDNSKMGTKLSETGESSRMEGRSEADEGFQLKEASEVEEVSEVEEASEVKEASKVKEASVVVASNVQFGDKKFFLADETSTWYQHLSRGRCAELLSMLKEDPLLLRQKGKGNVTVLHKAVHHGHVELVRYVMEEMFDKKGISAHFGNWLTLEDLLCEKDDREVTAVMLAATVGPWEGIYIFERAIEIYDNYHKTEADKQDTTGCQTNCSGIVGEYRLNERELEVLRTQHIERIGTDPAARLRLGNRVIRSVERFRQAISDGPSRHHYVVEPIVKGVLDENDYDIIDLKEAFNRRDDYNSQPIEALFFHFLCGCCGIHSDGFRCRIGWKESAARVAQKIVDKIMGLRNVDLRLSLMFDLFNYLDPQGRTPLHVAGMAGYEVEKEYKFRKCGIIGEVLKLIPSGPEYKRCVNVRDGSGRSIFHQACILKNPEDWHQILDDKRVDLDARVDLDERVDWDVFNQERKERLFGPLVHRLLYWRSPGAQYKSLETWLEDIPPEDLIWEYSKLYPTGLHLLILYGHEDLLEQLLEVKGQLVDVNARLWRGSLKSSLNRGWQYIIRAPGQNIEFPFGTIDAPGIIQLVEVFALRHHGARIDSLHEQGLAASNRVPAASGF